jgi:hypothetical protein
MLQRNLFKILFNIPKIEELSGLFPHPPSPSLLISHRAAKGNIDTSHAADPIIVHPDVRKMLLTQKAFAEGGRAMIYSSALMNDQVSHPLILCSSMAYLVTILIAAEVYGDW